MKIKILCLLFILFGFSSFAQDAIVDFGKNKMILSEKFFIKIVVSNTETRPSIVFPEIQGFKKLDKPTSTKAVILNGVQTFEHLIIQNYEPQKEGTWKVPSTEFKIGAKNFKIPEYYITISEPIVVSLTKQKPTELKEKASLALMVDKARVYQGEGIPVAVVFNIYEGNEVDFDFTSDFGKILDGISSKIKPKNCLVETESIKKVEAFKTSVNGKNCTQFLLYEAIFYPLDEKPVAINSISIPINRILNTDFKKSGVKVFSTQPKTISVQKLPNHPLQNNSIVGDFKLTEKISSKNVSTGESINLDWVVSGAGDFNLLNINELTNNNDFDFYQPEVKSQKLNLKNGNGEKRFQISIVPKSNGVKNLGNYFNFYYFNARTNKYDTLKSSILIEVSGTNLKTEKAVSDAPNESIYDGLENENSNISYFDFYSFIRGLSNVCAVFMTGFLIYLFVQNRKK